jgi:flagellar FliL protein
MKKNILTVIILAATLINLTLIAVMLFVFMPTVKQTNHIITKVAQIVDLELESVPVQGEDTIGIEDIATYVVEDELTINLAAGKDGKQHMARAKATLSLNKKAEDFTKINELMAQYDAQIQEIIIDEVSKMTFEDFTPNKDIVKAQILTRIQTEVFDSECIIGITFSQWVAQ